MYVNVILENQYMYHGKAHFSLPLNNYANALTVYVYSTVKGPYVCFSEASYTQACQVFMSAQVVIKMALVCLYRQSLTGNHHYVACKISH